MNADCDGTVFDLFFPDDEHLVRLGEFGVTNFATDFIAG